MLGIRKLFLFILRLMVICSLLSALGIQQSVNALGMPKAGIRKIAEKSRENNSKMEDFLNTDGTLKLDSGVSGSLDLSGWDIQLDAQRGPVFRAEEEMRDDSSQVDIAEGHWGSLSDTSAIPGGVNAIAVNGTDVYVVGFFLNAGGIPEADHIAKWDGVKWSALGSDGKGNGAINNIVYAIAVDGSNVYIAGDFWSINNNGKLIQYGGVAKWDGRNWSALGNLYIVSTDAYKVRALAVSGTNVYVGGDFYYVYSNDVLIADKKGLLKWDGVHWAAIGGSAAPNGIRAIVINGENIYIGGDFVDAGNVPEADKVAKWDGNQWSALGSNGAGNGALNESVYTIAVNGSDIYVGGTFTNAANIAEADYIAKWDGMNWSALGSALENGPVNNVRTIMVDGTDVYIGGHFTNAGGVSSADVVAKWNGENWSALGNNGAGDGSLSSLGEVDSIASGEGGIYVGGVFGDVNNNGIIRPSADYFAGWDGVNWSAVGNGDSSLREPSVDAITVIGTNVYVGGCFEDVDDNYRFDHLVKWDGTSWTALWLGMNPPPTYSGCVSTLATDGTNLYVGGTFDYGIAKWNGGWSYLIDGSTGLGPSKYMYIGSIAVDGTDVYVGGEFIDLAGIQEADGIARWDGAHWSALGGDGNGDGSLKPDLYGSGPAVESIVVNGNDVYVGGWFGNIRNGLNSLNTADYVAKWDGENWSALGSNGKGDGALNGPVSVMASAGNNQIYVGGRFTDAGGIPQADYIAKWDGANWSALGGNGMSNGSLKPAEEPYPFDVVTSIVINGPDVYVGGYFTNVNNYGSILGAADYIAKWDGVNWTALSNNGFGNGSLNNTVYSLALSGSNLYVGGWFNNVNDSGFILNSADYIASYKLKPSVPQLISPTRGVLLYDVTMPILMWQYYMPLFDHYQLQLAMDDTFVSPIYDVNLSSSEYMIPSPLSINSGYYWRVRAYDKGGVTTGWSPTEIFRIALPGTSLSAPADGATFLNLRPIFDWSDVIGAAFYKLQISESSNFVQIIAEEDSQYSTITLIHDLPPAKTLYWRVRAEGGNGPSRWTEARWFTTPNPPGIPVLMSPKDNAMVEDTLPLFKWSKVSAPRNTKFDHNQIQIASDSAFTSMILDANVTESTSRAFTPGTPLGVETMYYWRVRAVNSDGEASSWSRVNTFKTTGDIVDNRPRTFSLDAVLPSPVAVSSSADSFLSTLHPILDWNDVQNATGYIVQTSLDPEFRSSLLVSATTVNSEYSFITNLPRNTVIYWRVLTIQENSFSNWSQPYSFKVQ